MSVSYLGINMGSTINVVDSNGRSIGKLNRKERFTYSFDIKTINSQPHKTIWFLNSSGVFGRGYILDSAPIQNWMNYRFYDPSIGYHFKVDGTAQVYSGAGQPVAQAHTGDCIIPAANARSGDNFKHYLSIDGFYRRSGSSWIFYSANTNHRFIDTGVAYNSGNTIVYGKWN